MELADQMGKILYGMTPATAIERNICIRCKKPPEFYTRAGEEEYKLTGMCEPCWDKEFGDL